MLESGRDAVSPAAACLGPREPDIDMSSQGQPPGGWGSATPRLDAAADAPGRAARPPDSTAPRAPADAVVTVGIPVLVYGVMATVAVIAFLGVISLFLTYSQGPWPDPRPAACRPARPDHHPAVAGIDHLRPQRHRAGPLLVG